MNACRVAGQPATAVVLVSQPLLCDLGFPSAHWSGCFLVLGRDVFLGSLLRPARLPLSPVARTSRISPCRHVVQRTASIASTALSLRLPTTPALSSSALSSTPRPLLRRCTTPAISTQHPCYAEQAVLFAHTSPQPQQRRHAGLYWMHGRESELSLRTRGALLPQLRHDQRHHRHVSRSFQDARQPCTDRLLRLRQGDGPRNERGGQ